MFGSHLRALGLSLSAAVTAVFCAPTTAQVPSPKEFLGHAIGEDYFLANYTQLRSYWAELAQRSPRMTVEQIGTTSYGQPMEIAIISSPANIEQREKYRELLYRLSRGRDTDAAVVRELAARGKSIVWIDAGMHATESVAAQNIIELTYRMTSRDDEEVREILDNVILLVCPANPDGLEMVANTYMATKRVGGLPVLYQKYIGHDNNRDHYAGNMSETRAITGALYRRWNPQIVYNHHQSAPRGTIIFTPPFRDPFNFNVDPIVVRGIDLVAAHMNNRFTAEGKAGVISRTGASYSTWWNGGLRTTVYFHNMIGILTEVYGSPNPGKVTQPLSRRVPYTDYPLPIASQEWHARQTIEYLQTSNCAILALAARYRKEFLYNTWRMARNSIERGERAHWTPTPKLLALAKKRDRINRRAGNDEQNGEEGARRLLDAFADPALQDAWVYVLPADQPDFAAATRFVRSLRRAGVEVHRVRGELKTGGKTYPSGSFVVKAAQAFRPHVRDMFEPQWHPDDVGTGGDPVRPYDSAGWTLAMQMGIEFDRLFESVDGDLENITAVEVEFQPGALSPGRAGYLMSHSNINSFIATNRLLAAGEKVHWLSGSTGVDAGTVYITAGEKTVAQLAQLSRELGVSFRGVQKKPAGTAQKLRPVRIGLFDRFGGNMATGWTQWALEQFEFPLRLVHGDEIHAGKLRDQFDVLIFNTGLPSVGRADRTRGALRGRRGRSTGSKKDLNKLRDALPPFEDWSDLESRQVTLKADKAIPALEEFLASGGVVLAFGSQARTLSKHLDLPVREGVYVEDSEAENKERRARSAEYFIPGSLLELDVDVESPIGYGVKRHQVAMFRRSPVFEVLSGKAANSDKRVTSVVNYAQQDVLASGWAIGEKLVAGKSAVLRAEVGGGKVYLFGADVLYRGQPLGTFKFVFNAILGGTAETVSSVR